ncbi:MAG TPA: hypothetical protein VIA62_05630 [Thermoanaerobaculia bacterium]|jgi:hypothetical protein|nr:hypothetical protein [Thermoanaerobaculia bacterium]
MRLLRIAKGRWEVLAEVEPGGSCPVLDRLDQAGSRRETQVFLSRFLRVYLPLEGPPTSSLPRCRPLADGVFELRGQASGQEPPLLFFSDAGQRIVCTSAPDSRQRYFEAKAARGLQISEEAL